MLFRFIRHEKVTSDWLPTGLGTGQNSWEYGTKQCGSWSPVISLQVYTGLYIIFTDSSMGSDNICTAYKHGVILPFQTRKKEEWNQLVSSAPYHNLPFVCLVLHYRSLISSLIHVLFWT